MGRSDSDPYPYAHNSGHSCCGAPEDGNHADDCPMVAGVDENFKRDMSGETFQSSYFEHSASAIRKRVLQALATTNGHSTSASTSEHQRWVLPKNGGE